MTFENRNNRKTLTGKVVSAQKTQKTNIVEVDRYKKHLLYGKRFKKTKRYAVHDEAQVAKVNDMVMIMETGPLSKTKHFRLYQVLSTASDVEKEAK
ncbi:30S ribosomal protein S17 [Mycoplasmopsis synoviae]